MQLDGLATGMDTTSMIDQLVALESQPILQYEEEISQLKQTQDAWRDVNSRLDKLEGLTTDLKLSATFDSRTAESSNEDAVTATASNDAAEANYDINIQQTAEAHRIAGSRLSDSSTAISDLDGFAGIAEKNVININSTDITINSSDTLNEISTKINEAGAGVNASIVDNHLIIESSETGVDNELVAGDNITDSNGVLESLGIFDTNGNIADELQPAQNARIDINGIENIESSTNSFEDAVDGVNFEISAEAETNTTATISVAKNTQKAVDAVQSFVDQYNSAMDFLDSKTDYNSDTEEAAILQGDSTAMRLQMRLRSLVTDQVKESGEYKTLSSVGIEVDRDGVMELDSEKLTDAINNSAEEVKSLFNANTEENGFDGMAVRVDSYLDQLMQSNTGIIPRRIDFFDTRIENLNEDIADVEDRVQSTRERYEQEFAAMEEAISEMNQQQSWMQSQLSSMGGSITSMM